MAQVRIYDYLPIDRPSDLNLLAEKLASAYDAQTYNSSAIYRLRWLTRYASSSAYFRRGEIIRAQYQGSDFEIYIAGVFVTIVAHAECRVDATSIERETNILQGRLNDLMSATVAQGVIRALPTKDPLEWSALVGDPFTEAGMNATVTWNRIAVSDYGANSICRLQVDELQRLTGCGPAPWLEDCGSTVAELICRALTEQGRDDASSWCLLDRRGLRAVLLDEHEMLDAPGIIDEYWETTIKKDGMCASIVFRTANILTRGSGAAMCIKSSDAGTREYLAKHMSYLWARYVFAIYLSACFEDLLVAVNDLKRMECTTTQETIEFARRKFKEAVRIKNHFTALVDADVGRMASGGLIDPPGWSECCAGGCSPEVFMVGVKAVRNEGDPIKILNRIQRPLESGNRQLVFDNVLTMDIEAASRIVDDLEKFIDDEQQEQFRLRGDDLLRSNNHIQIFMAILGIVQIVLIIRSFAN